MAEHADKALAVIHKHRIAIEEVIADQDYLARCRGLDRCTSRYGEVEPGVRVALFAIEEAAHAELARQRTIDRFVQQQVAGCVGAEGAVGLDLDRQLVVDALDIGGVGIDLTLVFQGDVLLGVFFAAHRKAQVAPVGGDLLATGFDR